MQPNPTGSPESDPTQQVENMKSAFSSKQLAEELYPVGPDSTSVDKYADSLLQPIPLELPSVAGWKEVPLLMPKDGGEKLVPLGAFSREGGQDNSDIATSPVYDGRENNSPYGTPESRLEGALSVMFLREGVAKRIRHAQQSLPESHHLVVFDAYRPLEVQNALYDHYLGELKSKHPDWAADDLSQETQKYVSLPSVDATRPSPHNTGGSVDLAIYRLPEQIDTQVKEIDDRLDELYRQTPEKPTPEQEANDPAVQEAYLLEVNKIGLIRQNAEMLNFGTKFDHGGSESALNYFEKLEQQGPLSADETEARDNRRMLYNAMVQTGMQPYEDEWWHYNAPESQMGAQTAGFDHAEYDGVVLDQVNYDHNMMIEEWFANNVITSAGLREQHKVYYGPVLGEGAYLSQLARQGVMKTRDLADPTKPSDPRDVTFTEAEIIAPGDIDAA